jgi:hypothetical protein
MKEKYNGIQWKIRMKVMNEGETQWNTMETHMKEKHNGIQ